jgi:hypothetical protein
MLYQEKSGNPGWEGQNVPKQLLFAKLIFSELSNKFTIQSYKA